MKTSRFGPLGLAVIVGLLLLAVSTPASAHGRPAAPAPTVFQGIPVTGIRPGASLIFVENTGQFAGGIRFQASGDGRVIRLAEDALWITAWAPHHGVNLRLRFVGATPHPRLEPFHRLEAHVSYFVGSDPAGWRPAVPVWGGARYVDLYPGIDLELAGENGQIVPRLVARPGADLTKVRLDVQGAEALALENDRIRLATAVGDLTLPLFEVTGVDHGSLSVPLPTLTGTEVSAPFAAAPQSPIAWSQSETQVQSDLLYSTYLGGDWGDEGLSVTTDEAGNAYVLGTTISDDFPTTPGAFDLTYSDGHDAFVAKLNADGSALVYATYLGGNDDECNFGGYPILAGGIAVDGQGNAYVTGFTYSSDFPTTSGALDRTRDGTTDAFVTKLSPNGDALVYSTYLGGASDDRGYGVAVNGSGNAYVTGVTQSPDFPTTLDAYDTSFNSAVDAFVAKLNPAGDALVYGTFLGGRDTDGGRAITVDEAGDVYITGWTWSEDMPTTPGAYKTCQFAYSDAFAAKLDPSGSDLLYATCLGGSDHDSAEGMAIDESGAAYIAGETWSADFPVTSGAFDMSANGNKDGFVAKLSPAGSELIYATYLGGGTWDDVHHLALDGVGAAVVVGVTTSSNFPTTAGAFDTTHDGHSDGFVTVLNSSGSALAYSTYLGGSQGTSIDEYAHGLAVGENGGAYVTGATWSTDFPTTSGAYDTLLGFSGEDAFVAKLKLPSPNVDTYVQAPALIGAPPGGVAVVPIEYGNQGATTATEVLLTATLSTGLLYSNDTSGLTPVPIGDAVTWGLPDLAFHEGGQFDLLVNLTGTAPVGARYPIALEIGSTGTEDNPSDNATEVEIVVVRQCYLPLILRGQP